MLPRMYRSFFFAVTLLVVMNKFTSVQCIVNEDYSSDEEDSYSSCTTVWGKQGTCKPIIDCPPDQWSGSFDDICRFGRHLKIVCCVKKGNFGRSSGRPGYKDKTRERLNSVSRFGNNFIFRPGHDFNGKNNFAFNPNQAKSNTKRISEIKFEEYMDKIFFNTTNTQRELNPQGRVNTSPGQYPHMSALGWTLSPEKIDWKCGGNLISEVFVLTAAHCASVDGKMPDLVQIGDLNLLENETTVTPQTFGVKWTYMHPMYESAIYYFDIGLVELSTRARFTEFVRPACLWSRYDIPHENLVAMGYGATEFGGIQTKTLTELRLNVMDNAECNRRLPTIPAAQLGVIEESQICAIDPSGRTDTCQGDSGGPLQMNVPKHGKVYYYLVGITSYGISCGSMYPSVYTRIAFFIDWIENIVWPI